MASSKQLKSKIRTVGNIKQITRAMEMVSATKMRKSQEIALSARPYAKKALGILRSLLLYAGKESLIDQSHFFKRTGRKRTCLVVVTSDRGLCGGFNSAVLREASKYLKENSETDVVTVGKKAKEFFQSRNVAVVEAFSDFSDIITLQDATPLTEWLLSRYERHKYDAIVFCSTTFISALNQHVETREILPLTIEGLNDIIQRIVPKSGKYSEQAINNNDYNEETSYILEPSAKEVFESLLADLFRVEVLHFLLESNASEHSARMIAMKNATENAKELQERLQLVLNKARQSAITQELTEISSAREALSSE